MIDILFVVPMLIRGFINLFFNSKQKTKLSMVYIEYHVRCSNLV